MAEYQEPSRQQLLKARKPQEAVALRYDRERDQAPRLLAKGKGSVAERILAIARKNGVPLYEDHDLVELLGVLDIDAEIPPHLYHAMAEVLAHIYRADRRLR